ncbi:MAG: triacylglycerol lipase [Actinomycetota bacterium]|nr:triacylglycerol lipase [Actinomycetota bacterium]
MRVEPPTYMRRVLIALCVLASALTPAVSARAEGSSWPGHAHYSVPTSKLDAALACHGGLKHLTGTGTSQPVLLVHGTGVPRDLNWSWNYWNALPQQHFDVCWIQLPQNALGDIQIASEYVARAIQIMHRKTGEKIDILGHSQGGLEPRWAIKFFPSGRFVDDYIGLASPNHGTLDADAATADGSANAAVWQMRTSARFIAALNAGDETPGGISYTNIYSETDELIQPVGTQALDGGTNILLQDVCPGRAVDHLDIVGDAVTYYLVIDALTHPGGAQRTRIPTDACQQGPMPGATPPPFDAGAIQQGLQDFGNAWSATVTDREPPLMPYARP